MSLSCALRPSRTAAKPGHAGTGEEVGNHFARLRERLDEGLDRTNRHFGQVAVAVVNGIGARAP